MGFIYFLLFSLYFFRDCNRIRKELEEKDVIWDSFRFFFFPLLTRRPACKEAKEEEKKQPFGFVV
jgi:hypothetical protein